MSSPIRVESDRRTIIEAETIKAGFLDQGFINTMRFSELNGPEEYDNTHLFVDWHACFEYGLQQLMEWLEWVTRQMKDSQPIPDVQMQSIQRTIKDLKAYDFSKPCDDKVNIKTIRNNLMKYNWNLVLGIYTYDGHTGILNGRMARDKGHKKDLLEVVKNEREREKQIEIGEKKHFWQRD